MADVKTMFVIYGIAFGTLSLCLAALYRRALRGNITPALEPEELRRTHGEIVRWCYAAVVAAGSIVFALLLPQSPPHWLIGMPGIFYGLMALTPQVIALFVRSAQKAS
jgi:hypothetical protein